MVSKKPSPKKRKTKKEKNSSDNLSAAQRNEAVSGEEKEKIKASWVLPEDKERQARRWLWIGVGSFIVMIIVLWGWSVKLRFQSVSWQTSQEYALGKNTKSAWNQIFAEQNQSIVNKQLEKTQIKSIINQLLAGRAPSTTANGALSQTSTPVASTSAK